MMLSSYIASRLLRAVVTLLIVVSLAFLVLRLSGDPALVMLGPDAPPDAIAAFRTAWGLDQPLFIQYFDYLGAVAVGDLGQSMRDGREALAVVLDRLPMTLALTVPAIVVTLGLGLPAGIYAAVHRNTFIDRAIMALSVLGFAVPSFVLALLLVMVLAVNLGWLPSGGSSSLRHAILPIIALGIIDAAKIARFARSAMIEVLTQPYIRAAKAKGVPWARVVRRHALPNAAIPTITVLGLLVGNIAAGATVVESIFSWPGIGRLLVTSVASRDLAVVQCILLLVSVVMVAANLTVDLLYGWIDPRLRTGHARAGG